MIRIYFSFTKMQTLSFTISLSMFKPLNIKGKSVSSPGLFNWIVSFVKQYSREGPEYATRCRYEPPDNVIIQLTDLVPSHPDVVDTCCGRDVVSYSVLK